MNYSLRKLSFAAGLTLLVMTLSGYVFAAEDGTASATQVPVGNAGCNHAPVGGGTTKAGFTGEYYPNPEFRGTPAFTRRDVRINFNWKKGVAGRGLPVGGASAPGMKDFPLDDFSIRWTGQVVPRFSETYTFRITGKDGVRLKLGGKTMVDSLDNSVVREVAFGPMNAGEKYDVVLEYVNKANVQGSEVRLEWASLNTPWEVIEPLSFAQVGDGNASQPAGAAGRADMFRAIFSSGRWEYLDKKPLKPSDMDENGWPTVPDFSFGLSWFGENTYTGTYKICFTGQAAIEVGGGMKGVWNMAADGSGQSFPGKLPKGTGYSAKENTTTIWFLASAPNHFSLQFTGAERAPGQPGISGLHVYYPIFNGAKDPHLPGEIRARETREVFSNFLLERQQETGLRRETTWENRTLPAWFSPMKSEPDPKGGLDIEHGRCFEELIMLINQQGHDWHLCFGVDWDEEFMLKFAQMIRYGSDGKNPYDHYVENPKYPPLNPNLRIYLEHANELPWAVYPAWIWDNLRAKARENHPDWKIVNYDGKGAGVNFLAMSRYHALRMKQMSDAFRKVYADVPGVIGDRARIYLFGQYEGALMQNMLQFLDDYFNNGDGQQHVQEPHPPSYFIWGGGGAIYYGTKNRFGLMEKESVANDNFDQPALHDGQAVLRPDTASGWTFTGKAGICSTHNPGQWLVNGQQLPKDPAPVQETSQWAGLKFTVGNKDLYVYQIGRWAQDGNKGSHEFAIFDTKKKELRRWLADVDLKKAKPGDYACAWCNTKSSGRDRQLPVRLLAGQTYYLVCQEQAGANADRFFGGDTDITPSGTGLTIEAAVIGDGKTWQETAGKRSFGPLTMRYTSERLTTSEGEIGVPPDWTPKFPTWQGPEPFDLGTQCAFLCGKSSIRQTVNVEKAGTYWVTLSLAVDQASPGWPPTVCRILVDGSDRTSRPLPIGGFDFKTVSFNYAASNCFHLEPGAHEIVIEGISEKGTLYADSVHVCSEDAFYGGLGAPNFPSGGNAFGQVAATGYYKTAHAECDMAYNWGLVPCTYEGGWAVQSDFDHYSMLAWDDLRYGGHDTHSELTQQALQNCFDVWCKRGGFIYAYFYPFQRNIAQTDAPLYQRILAMNDRLTPFPDTGGPIPGTLDCDQPHYQFDPSKEWSYHGPSTGNPEKGRTVPARGWKSWIVTCKETSDYRIALVASGGGAELLVDGAAVAGGDAAGNPGVKVKLVAGVHSIKVKSADQAVNVEKITVEKAKSE